VRGEIRQLIDQPPAGSLDRPPPPFAQGLDQAGKYRTSLMAAIDQK
jgi:hypothetical protein